MKIIFVDVDGVLNCKNTTDTVMGDDGRRYDGIDSDKIQLLKEIIDKTDAYIILSSTWRLYDTFTEYLEEKLGDYKVRIKGITPRSKAFTYTYRFREIQNWFNENDTRDIVNYIILDDIDEEMVETFGDHYFKTDVDIGLTREITDKCIEYLNKE